MNLYQLSKYFYSLGIYTCKNLYVHSNGVSICNLMSVACQNAPRLSLHFSFRVIIVAERRATDEAYLYSPVHAPGHASYDDK